MFRPRAAALGLVLIYLPATIDHKLPFAKGSNRPGADNRQRPLTAKSGLRQAKATRQELLTMMEAFCLENRGCVLAFRYIDVQS